MLDVRGLKKSYGKTSVIKGIDLSLDTGMTVAIVGRNGCGKSTLIRMLAGVIKPDAGVIEYSGRDIFRDRSVIRNCCGYLPQGDPLIGEINVQDNISLFSGYRGKPDSELVELLELDEILKTPVSSLSGGMKRRVSIACAIVNKPSVLLMDDRTCRVPQCG